MPGGFSPETTDLAKSEQPAFPQRRSAASRPKKRSPSTTVTRRPVKSYSTWKTIRSRASEKENDKRQKHGKIGRSPIFPSFLDDRCLRLSSVFLIFRPAFFPGFPIFPHLVLYPFRSHAFRPSPPRTARFLKDRRTFFSRSRLSAPLFSPVFRSLRRRPSPPCTRSPMGLSACLYTV